MKGRTLLRSGLKWALISFLADFLALLPVPVWAAAAIDWASMTVFILSGVSLAVWAVWNASDFLEGSGRERELPRPDEGCMPSGRREDGSTAIDPATSAATKAIQRAVAMGTVSLNGESWAGSWAHLASSGSLSRAGHGLPGGLPAGSQAVSQVVKSECDGCGVPLDVAWCTPGTPYLCRRCLEQEIFPFTPGRP